MDNSILDNIEEMEMLTMDSENLNNFNTSKDKSKMDINEIMCNYLNENTKLSFEEMYVITKFVEYVNKQ